MAKIKIFCPNCDQSLQCDDKYRGRKVKCPHCKNLVPVPQIIRKGTTVTCRRSGKKKILIAGGTLILLATIILVGIPFVLPIKVHWPDRRPIGTLFLASDYHSSAKNPRGWFNDPNLDVTGTNGLQRFRTALLDYTDRSIAILKRTGAQGVIVWDVEGEQFPHKTTFIGDPRELGHLAPEMAAVADEFLGRLRGAGLRVGLTIRPQQLVFDTGQPRQTQVINTKQLLLEKIDYARKRWGATMFYIDSNGGIRRPDELWQLRQVAKLRPDILLIPEHHYLPYRAFSAPYLSLRKGDSPKTANWARRLFPGSFQVLDISNAPRDWAIIATARSQGDVLLFPAWFPNPESQLMESFANEPK